MMREEIPKLKKNKLSDPVLFLPLPGLKMNGYAAWVQIVAINMME